MTKKRIFRTLPLLWLAGALCIPTLSAGKDKEEVTLKRNRPHNIRGVSHYGLTFGDRNSKQLNIAHAIGVRPLSSRKDACRAGGRLRHIETCGHYTVDSLTHSIPYLTPGAAALLDKIGCNFLDSLAAKGLNPNKVIVTSVLRTREDVKRLRRRNGNATAVSAHSYGTTFDISWKRFEKVESESGRPMQDVRPEHLKMVLAEVLRDLKGKGLCYVKYEIRQACFHITSRQ